MYIATRRLSGPYPSPDNNARSEIPTTKASDRKTLGRPQRFGSFSFRLGASNKLFSVPGRYLGGGGGLWHVDARSKPEIHPFV